MTNQQEVKNEIKKLIINSITPLEWEIKELGKYEEPKTRLKAFEARGLTIEINNLPSKAERELITTELAKALGRTLEAAEDLLDKTDDLMNTLGGAFHGGDFKKSGEGIRIAEIIYDWFLKNNGKFYVTEDDRPWLFYHGKHYEIKTANDSFNALMFNLTKLAHIEKPGNLVWYALCQLCLNKGDKIATSTWCFTDREADTIYLNLSLPHHKILKISPGEDPKLLDNGTNEHSVLLKESHNIKTFKYMPDAVEAEGFSAIKKYLMDCAPCELPQRYFIVCWFISNFMIDYFSDRGIVQIIGSSGLGKSKIPERMSTLLFGQNLVGQGTGSADVRIASQDPLNFQDNLENKDLTQSKINFFLLLANAATKNKAKAGSDTAVVGQKLNSLCVVTSIEPFPGKWPELINRTFSIILEGKYSLTNYV
ncbi:MAG: hypothetical protein KAS32_13145, partial [Candidatus Peribacteraceae bacterium]|nr:hypothetical protein [Candidatus Peribacteraceae bacterium]